MIPIDRRAALNIQTCLNNRLFNLEIQSLRLLIFLEAIISSFMFLFYKLLATKSASILDFIKTSVFLRVRFICGLNPQFSRILEIKRHLVE